MSRTTPKVIYVRLGILVPVLLAMSVTACSQVSLTESQRNILGGTAVGAAGGAAVGAISGDAGLGAAIGAGAGFLGGFIYDLLRRSRSQ